VNVVTEVVTVDAVSKQYGDRVALHEVSFSLPAGASVGYLGPNGAGKSTTLKILAGLSRPTRGAVRVVGRDPYTDRVGALRHVGALVETPGVPPYLAGRDLLEYVARVKGASGTEVRSAARRAAEGMDVAGHLDRPFGSLSTGLARRMLLAAALVGEPELLLLDEPTLGLDPAARHDLRATLRNLSKGGLTLFLSTHLLEDIAEVCGRVLFLRAGSVVGDEPVRISSDPGSGAPDRVVRLDFSADVEVGRLAQALGPDYRVTAEGPRQASVRFSGADVEQANLVAQVVRAGLPLLGVSSPESDLARRYFQRVGREDAA